MRKFYAGIIFIIILMLGSLCPVYAENLLPTEESDEGLSKSWYIDRLRGQNAWQLLLRENIIPGEGVVIALIDTGVDTGCSEIADAIWVNEAEYYGIEGVDDDNNGYVDDINGLNLANSYSYMTDLSGHGTQMAGVMGMQPFNGGGVGLAYGARIMPIKVSKDTNYDVDKIIEGIKYAVDNGADIINMAFASYKETPALTRALEEASESCVLVASAGNESYVSEGDNFTKEKLLEDGYGLGTTYPAGLDCCIGVMAESSGGELASFSNWDQTGGSVYELISPGQEILTVSRGGSFVTKNGSSYSAALVSGSIALMKCVLGDSVTAPELKELFLTSMTGKIRFSYGGYAFDYTECSAEEAVRAAFVKAGISISENGISDNGISDNGISDNGISGEPVYGDGISGSGISGNDTGSGGISENGISGNGISGNGISENAAASDGASEDGCRTVNAGIKLIKEGNWHITGYAFKRVIRGQSKEKDWTAVENSPEKARQAKKLATVRYDKKKNRTVIKTKNYKGAGGVYAIRLSDETGNSAILNIERLQLDRALLKNPLKVSDLDGEIDEDVLRESLEREDGYCRRLYLTLQEGDGSAIASGDICWIAGSGKRAVSPGCQEIAALRNKSGQTVAYLLKEEDGSLLVMSGNACGSFRLTALVNGKKYSGRLKVSE